MKKFKRKVLDMLMSNNSGSNLRQQLLDGAPFRSSLLYTAIPTRAASGTTATFTRATTATVRDNEGVVRTAIAGEARFEGARRVRNLLTYTEDFSNAAWLKYRMTISASAINSPISGVMYKTSDSDSAADRHFVYQNVTTVSGNQYVGSVVALAGELSFLRLSYLNSGLTTVKCGVFNLSTGLAGAVDAGITQNITSLGGGFYRCSIAFTASDSGGLARFQIEGIASNTTAVIAGSSSQGIYTGNAQLEDVTAQTTQTAGEYVSVGVASSPYYHGSMVDGVKCFPTDLSGNPLTTMERYKPELAATNLCLQSNAFTTTWAALGSPSITQDAIGPDGATSAWTITDNQSGSYYGVSQTGIAFSSGGVGCASVFIKKKLASPAYPLVIFYHRVASVAEACGLIVNEVAGTAAVISAGGYVAPTAYAVESYNSDYWRVWLSKTQAGGTLTTKLELYPAGSTDGTTLSASGQGSTVFYGMQFEIGSFPTSYIATTTVAVTRDPDILDYSSGDIPNIVWLAAGVKRESGVSGVGVIAELHDGTQNEDLYAYFTSATNIGFIGRDGGSTVLQSASVLSATNTYTPGTRAMVSLATSALAAEKKASDQGSPVTLGVASAGKGTVTKLRVGAYSTGAFQLQGNVGPLYGWTRVPSQSESNAVSAP